jgi:hypothetical protein
MWYVNNVVFAAVENTRSKIVKNSGGAPQTMIFMSRKTCNWKMQSREIMWNEWMRKVSSFNAA